MVETEVLDMSVEAKLILKGVEPISIEVVGGNFVVKPVEVVLVLVVVVVVVVEVVVEVEPFSI